MQRNYHHRLFRAAVAATVLSGAAFAAHAQPAPSIGGETKSGPRAEGPRNPAQRMQMMRERLAITPAQEGAFQAWLGALRPPEGMRRGQRPDRDAVAAMTTPERIDRRMAMAEQRLAMARQRGEATKRFYAQLSTEQRQTFDAMRPMGGRKGGPGMRGGQRGRGGPGGHDHQG